MEEEFCRTARAFDRMAFVWKELAGRHTRRGYMAKECKDKSKAAGGTGPEKGTSLTDHIHRAQKNLG